MELLEGLKNDLIVAVGSANLSTSLEERERASRDETHEMEPVQPQAVVFVHSHDDVVKIAQVCAKHRTSMTPRGAGSGKSGGCVPVQGGVVIDFSKMNRILSVNEADLTATVEAGVILGTFQEHVSRLGLYYPPDPASLDWCTLGGNVAENAGGPSAVKYGVTKDYVLGLRIVLSDGRHFRIGKQTIKGVTGLDLVSLMCGSEGLLAFVTEITLKLLAKPEHVQTALCRFANRSEAIAGAIKIRQSVPSLKCLELIDSTSLQALLKMGVPGMRDFNADSLLLVEVDGADQDEVLDAMLKIDALLKSEAYLGTLVAKDEAEKRHMWDMRRKLSAATKRFMKYKISEDIVVPLSQLNTFLQEMDDLGSRYEVRICAFGHVGDGNLHIQIMYDDEAAKERMPALLEELFKATVRVGGTLTGEHGIGYAKKDYLALEQEQDLIELQRQLKAAFDSLGLLNPGKFI